MPVGPARIGRTGGRAYQALGVCCEYPASPFHLPRLVFETIDTLGVVAEEGEEMKDKDIVKRLRNAADTSLLKWRAHLYREAADDIERLRAKLEEHEIAHERKL